MKRLLASILALALVACDPDTTQADGTSSETATSLKLLATRLAGANLSGPSAPVLAARGLKADRSDTLLWRDVWDVPGGLPKWADTSSYYNYGTAIGLSPSFVEYEMATERQSASRGVRTNFVVGGTDLSTATSREQVSVWGCYVDESRSCSWGESPTEDGMQVLSAERTYALRNGSTLVQKIANPGEHLSQSDVVIDGRWTLKEESRVTRSGDTMFSWFVYRVYERGEWIGTLSARNVPGERPEHVDLDRLDSAVVSDREGNEVLPERGDILPRIPLRTDSVGLRDVSAGIDSARTQVLVRGRWNIKPRQVPPGVGDAVLKIAFVYADGSIEEAQRATPSLGEEGAVSWVFPAPSRAGAAPVRIRLRYIQSDLPLGSPGRARFYLHAAAEAEIAP